MKCRTRRGHTLLKIVLKKKKKTEYHLLLKYIIRFLRRQRKMAELFSETNQILFTQDTVNGDATFFAAERQKGLEGQKHDLRSIDNDSSAPIDQP